MDQVKICALGGLDENGKNLYVIEINKSIFIVEAGFKYPEKGQLGIQYIIPDFSYLESNKEKIKGIFLTHAHDDSMGAIVDLLKVVDVPIFTTAFTGKIVKELIKAKSDINANIKILKRNGDFSVANQRFKTFSVTHSIPDTFGLAFETDKGYIVFVSNYTVDYDVTLASFSSDLSSLAQIGKKGVLCLMLESLYADKPGHTAPKHRIAHKLESHFVEATGRIIITVYQQNLFRIIEILELVKKYNRKVYFHNPVMNQMLKIAEELNYYQRPNGLEVSAEEFDNNEDNMVIIISDSGPAVFNTMHNIAIGENQSMELRASDLVVVASPVVPGVEKVAGKLENELYKDGIKLFSLNQKEVMSMHPSSEDLKMFIYLFKPKYYMPIIGEYRHLIDNANIAVDMGYLVNNIIVLDNGQIASFENGKLKENYQNFNAIDVMVDGNASLDSHGLVLRDREILSKDGVIIIAIALDFNTKKIIAGPDVQTRGLVYLKDAEHIIKELNKIIINGVNELVESNSYSNADGRLIVKDRIQKYISKETGKRPMVLPTIIEVRN
ncbi:MAG: ribonuclease J [Erysipelotrichaceae bacterium]